MPDTFRIIDGVGWIGDRRFPFAQVDVRDHDIYSDGTFPYRERRMRVPAENGWTMSIVWGSGTYSDNHGHPHGFLGFPKGDGEWHEESTTAEIRIWSRDDWDALEDQVAGYLTTDQVLGLLNLMSSWATDEQPCITGEWLSAYRETNA